MPETECRPLKSLWSQTLHHNGIIHVIKQKFDDTKKRETRSHESKTNRQCNDKKKKGQTMICKIQDRKLKIEKHESH